jgi:hypothetical protein
MAEDFVRIDKLSRRVGQNLNWGAQQFLDVRVIEHRARLDQRMSERIGAAS